MMRLALKIGLILILAALLTGTAPSIGICYDGPDDPLAEAAAKEAVLHLGTERGSTALKRHVIGFKASKTLDIRGLKGWHIKGMSVQVKRILNDLNARQVGEKIQISLSSDVLFDFDKWNIKKSAETSLYKLANAVRDLNVKKILIEGHTDAKGTEKYNLVLSEKRAGSVKTWLVEKGRLDGKKIITKGYGESRPIAPNTNPDGSDCPEGRAKNRRVEIYVSLSQAS